MVKKNNKFNSKKISKKNIQATVEQQCFIDPNTECNHCITVDCLSNSPIMKRLVIKEFIATGVQGVVFNAQLDTTMVAIKISILNDLPLTMTRRKMLLNCKRSWYNVPGMIGLSKIFIKLWTYYNEDEFRNPIPTEMFQREIKLNQMLSDDNVGPHVFYGDICKKGIKTMAGTFDIGIMVMEKYDRTLTRQLAISVRPKNIYVKNRVIELSNILKQLRSKAKKVQTKILKHGDLHGDNVIVKCIGTFYPEKVNKYDVAIIDFGYDQSDLDIISISWEADLLTISTMRELAKYLSHYYQNKPELMELIL